MGQGGLGGSSASGRFWLCPQCHRHVPIRLDACRWRGLRPLEGTAPEAASAAAATISSAAAATILAAPAVVPPPLPSSPVAAAPYAGGGRGSASLDELVYPNERTLFAIGLAISIGFWLVLLIGTLGIALFYALGFRLLPVRPVGPIAYIRGNAVRITPQQYPDLYQRLSACCQRLGHGRRPGGVPAPRQRRLQRLRHALPGAQLPGALLRRGGRARGAAGRPQLLPRARARARASRPSLLAPDPASGELPAADRIGLPPRVRVHLRQLRSRVLQRRRGRRARL